MSNDKKKLVAFGDSITSGWPYGKEYSWVQFLKKNGLCLDIINAGVSGDTYGDMLERLEAEVLKYAPEHCIVMGGTNEAYQRIPQSILKENFLEIMNRLADIGCEVILGLPLPVDVVSMELYLKDIRQWYVEYSSKNNIKIIDFSSLMLNKEGTSINYDLFLDECHPNKEGHKIMGQYVVKRLKEFAII